MGNSTIHDDDLEHDDFLNKRAELAALKADNAKMRQALRIALEEILYDHKYGFTRDGQTRTVDEAVRIIREALRE